MIQSNLVQLHKKIAEIAATCNRDPDTIKLVAVSKRFPVESIVEAAEAGHYRFGENYLQEAIEKKRALGDRVAFHFIGNLQSNKAKPAAENFAMVETVDRPKIAAALHKYVPDDRKKLSVLIQVNVGNDEAKSGIDPKEVESLAEYVNGLNRLKLEGLMTMPPFTDDEAETRSYFRSLRNIGERLQEKGLLPAEGFELSMGMSGDFHLAIEEGATIIRVGTAIFGQRPALIKT